jgi:DNA-binding CsgD family transcriptional regulator
VQLLPVQRPPELSGEEIRLIGLLAQGLPDKQLANELGMPGLDVNRMALHLCGKLGAKSKPELIQRAREMGLLALDVTG